VAGFYTARTANMAALPWPNFAPPFPLLQTFPKDYRFETPHFERACEIVGNALPCVFAEAIARTVHHTIKMQRAPAEFIG
jgi:hypothetical protein